MPRRKREVVYEGVNNQGNQYTVYDDNAYRYKNVNQQTGETRSTYFDTNNGHRFFRKNGPDGYRFHENSNQGFRDYMPNRKPPAENYNPQGNQFQSYGNGSHRYNGYSGESSASSSSSYNRNGAQGSTSYQNFAFSGYAVVVPQ